MSESRDDDPAGDPGAQNVTADMLALLDPDPAVAEQRYQRLLTDLTSTAERRGSRYPEDDAAEALYRGLQKASQVNPRDKGFRKFVFGILRNVMKEGWRYDEREPPQDLTTLPPPIANRREFEQAEASLILRQLRHLLTQEQWELLERNQREDDHRAHCQELGVTPGYLRLMVHRLMKKLRAEVDKMNRRAGKPRDHGPEKK